MRTMTYVQQPILRSAQIQLNSDKKLKLTFSIAEAEVAEVASEPPNPPLQDKQHVPESMARWLLFFLQQKAYFLQV